MTIDHNFSNKFIARLRAMQDKEKEISEYIMYEWKFRRRKVALIIPTRQAE